MARIQSLALILAGLGILALATKAGGAVAVWSDGIDLAPPMFPLPDPQDTQEAASEIMQAPTPDTRIAAFLAVIRQFESRGQYDVVYIDPQSGPPAKYPNGHFSDFSRFPFSASSEGALITLGRYAGLHSTASGAYQINLPTYNEFAPALGITGFTPQEQDALGLAILKKTGAYDAALAGDLEPAFQLASKRWASLPGSTAGQNPQTLTTAQNAFNDFLLSVGA